MASCTGMMAQTLSSKAPPCIRWSSPAVPRRSPNPGSYLYAKSAALCVRASASKSGDNSQDSSPHLGALLSQAATTAISLSLAAALSLSPPALAVPEASQSVAPNPSIPELGVLIKGQPVKDPRSLLRYALPIDNKPIKEIQLPLELITEDLRLPGLKALDGVEKNVRQAARILNQNTDNILGDVAPAKKEEARKLLDQLQDELQEFQRIIQRKERGLVALQQKQALAIVGDIEETMVKEFPFPIPAEFAGKPWLKGRATLELVVNPVNNPNVKEVVFELTADGYNAPITAGNFVDLVQRGFYDGTEIQRADGFVVQTGDPDGPEEGFVDPKTGDVRTIPLEIFVEGDKAPIYHETTEELGRYKAIMRLPFNAFGTMAMAREEFDNDSASSQIFWLLKESELTPSSANILDGRYAVFGYITDNEDLLADLKVGDKIKYIKVKAGLDNLQNPSS